MFDFIFRTAEAYNQIGLFFGALICFGIGALIVGYSIYWRLHALRTSGTIIGVINEGGMYTPVYRYASPDAHTREAKSDTGSSSVRGKETGRVVPLLILPHNPARARQADDYMAEAVFGVAGMVMVVAGIWLAGIAITQYPVTPMTWIMAAGLLVYAASRIRRIMIPKQQRLSVAAWRKQHGLGEDATVDMTQVSPIEDLVASSDLQRSIRERQLQSRKWAPAVGIFAVVLIAAGIYEGHRVANLEMKGLRAEGVVVALKRETSSGSQNNGPAYHPVIRYHVETNVTVEFKDSVGSNPPAYRLGDKVTVLYLADDPRGQAIIDRGSFWNWAIPALILLVGVFLLGLTVVMLRAPQTPVIDQNLAEEDRRGADPGPSISSATS
jgi:Protein of unknown function (DUF3592)